MFPTCHASLPSRRSRGREDCKVLVALLGQFGECPTLSYPPGHFPYYLQKVSNPPSTWTRYFHHESEGKGNGRGGFDSRRPPPSVTANHLPGRVSNPPTHETSHHDQAHA
jgi:hypothetical protein